MTNDRRMSPALGNMKRLKKPPDFFLALTWVASVAAVLTLLWILESIVLPAWPAIQQDGLGFFTGTVWDVNRNRYGALPFLIGTAASSLIALCIALPLGIFIALFLSENFLPLAVRQVIRFVVELLAAIPSVVYGLWGIAVVIPIVQQFGGYLSDYLGSIPLFSGPATGNSMLTASLVLAIMVLPTITAVSRAALVAVPATLREGSYAVGATRWETIFRVLVPTAAPGIVAATILAFGRAMGETMAVAMLIGNSPRLSWSLLSPAGTLAALLANQFGEAQGLQISALMYAALALVLLTLFVNMAGEAVLRHAEKTTAGIR
ncbi:MAG: phosphate ABC transporter permease subunit PstC [Verrucomicrobia bacterium]|nr:phosphate ABC transporter permease subunit PstC [Verrucomicrobiota bacterium]MBV9300059.1 phosphate ABC transporter permease subunit PstC [Verrucomicrobiota bacterium]MBV9643819.1 phosphate ABC transporter permease subunit PstC [Verrucomicrobiota bacterium]